MLFFSPTYSMGFVVKSQKVLGIHIHQLLEFYGFLHVSHQQYQQYKRAKENIQAIEQPAILDFWYTFGIL